MMLSKFKGVLLGLHRLHCATPTDMLLPGRLWDPALSDLHTDKELLDWEEIRGKIMGSSFGKVAEAEVT